MPVTAAINANVMITESLTVLSSCYQNGANGLALCPCPPAWQAGPQADRWPRWRAILTIMQKCSSQLYVKLQPRDVCHTTPRGFNPSKVHESEGRTRGGADSIRAVTTRKVGPFYTYGRRGS